MTELATRAIYENVATLCDFTDKLKPLCEASDYAGWTNTSKAAFSTRIPSFLESNGQDLKAPNILSQIDRMTKRYAEFREAYDHLSEIVHPNGLGAMVYFATMSGGEDRIAFVDAQRSQIGQSIRSFRGLSSRFRRDRNGCDRDGFEKVIEAMKTKPEPTRS